MIDDEEDDPTGGLTFGPPRAREDDEPLIGFAPDLDEGGAAAAGIDWATPEGAAATTRSSSEEAALSARARRGPPRYPLAEAALARLLGEDVGVPRARPGDDGNAFTIGPAVMRPPPSIAVPAADELDLAPPDDAGSATDALMDDMVDVMLVGDDDGKQHVHLVFKEDVFGGLYLKLERTGEGLFATFLVTSDGDRRAVEGHVDLLLSRLRSRGMRVVGHKVSVRDD